MLRLKPFSKIFFSLGLLTFALDAFAETPLLMEGKSTIFQRVLIREQTHKYYEISEPPAEALAPLQSLFVYDKNTEWVKVGFDDAGNDLFWVKNDDVVEWNQNIVLTFMGTENTQRVMFFDDLDGLYEVAESEDPNALSQELLADAEEAEKNGSKTELIAALGPRNVVDDKTNPYVMPIISYEEMIFESGAFGNILRVAVANANKSMVENAPSAPDEFKAGVVFVVDTTQSMGPYIQATQAALNNIYSEIGSSNAQGKVSFGLIGYRDNTSGAPGLEYSTQKFLDLSEGYTEENFNNAIAQMSEASASSVDFREDSFAGIMEAIKTMDWSDFSAKYIILVTDAGPRTSDDELSQTGLDAIGLNRQVQEQIQGALGVIHLKTSSGENDHERAEQIYRELTQLPNQSSLYFPVENGDPELYLQEAKNLSQVIVSGVSAEGEPSDNAASDERYTALQSAGRTMRLAYLGSKESASAPDVFDAYVVDRDLSNQSLRPFSVRVLISKSQLSDLEQLLGIIIEEGERGMVNADEFFSRILAASANFTRRPNQLIDGGTYSLGEVSALSELIEGLPYKSQIMAISQDDWLRMGAVEQSAIINALREKQKRYQNYNETTDLWFDYLGTNTNGLSGDNLLYPLPLDDLP